MRFFGFEVTAAVLALMACGTAAAQGLTIKEYELGAPMTECPPNAVSINSTGPETVCQLGATTLANQRVTSSTVGFYQERLSSAYFKLSATGQYANGEVFQALKEKFGTPSSSQSHLNRYTWYRGAQILSFDGWSGHVLLMDQEAYRKITAEKAAKNKSDL